MILYKTKDGEVVSVDKSGGNGNIDLNNYLSKDNEEYYSPTGNYNPATKKYVDDTVGDSGKVLDYINRFGYNSGNDNDNTPATGTQSEADEWDYILDEENKTITLWDL